jgi:hypothetical protein
VWICKSLENEPLMVQSDHTVSVTMNVVIMIMDYNIQSNFRLINK